MSQEFQIYLHREKKTKTNKYKWMEKKWTKECDLLSAITTTALPAGITGKGTLQNDDDDNG